MTKNDLRIVFMGTPEFAAHSLQTLIDGGYNVVAVVTQPDKPVGRHASVLSQPPVKQLALKHSIPILQPEKMKDPDFLEALESYHADLQVVVAFRMLPEIVWAMPKLGTFNVHAALLPQYRGAAPINWAVINGERETGVTTFFLDHDIDTGRIIMQKRLAIPDDADAEYVHDNLMLLASQVAVETIDQMIAADGKIPSRPQEEFIDTDTVLHHAPKIFKDTCRINWQQTAKRVYDFVRGLSPYPGAWTTLMPSVPSTDKQKEQVVKIFKTTKTSRSSTAQPGTIIIENRQMFVNTADYQLEIIDLQLSGKRRMAVRDFLNGWKSADQALMFL